SGFTARASNAGPARSTVVLPSSLGIYNRPSAKTGEAETLPPSRSCQSSLPVFASTHAAKPASLQKKSQSPTSTGKHSPGTPLLSFQTMWLSVMSPFPVGPHGPQLRLAVAAIDKHQPAAIDRVGDIRPAGVADFP